MLQFMQLKSLISKIFVTTPVLENITWKNMLYQLIMERSPFNVIFVKKLFLKTMTWKNIWVNAYWISSDLLWNSKAVCMLTLSHLANALHTFSFFYSIPRVEIENSMCFTLNTVSINKQKSVWRIYRIKWTKWKSM